jgi:hypothetical protein
MELHFIRFLRFLSLFCDLWYFYIFDVDLPIINHHIGNIVFPWFQFAFCRIQLFFKDFIESFKDILIELVFDQCSLNDCVRLDVLVIVNCFIYFHNLGSFSSILLFLLELSCSFSISFQEDTVNSKEDFPKDTLDDIGNHIDIGNMHQNEV